jgi:predicted nucleotidyltransferase
MPVRSSGSSVLRWPDRQSVDAAARGWARAQAGRPGLEALGYFGSYARGDWGVGSDLDLVAIVSSSDEPFERRALAWDLSVLPVPAEILVYTRDEWARRLEQGDRFARMLRDETVWLLELRAQGHAEGGLIP